MGFNIVVSKPAIFLSLLNSLAPWNSHCKIRNCLANEFTKIRKLDSIDKSLLNEYTEFIGRTIYGEVEDCFFHKRNFTKTIDLIKNKLSKYNFNPLIKLIDRFATDFNKLLNSIWPRMNKRKSEFNQLLEKKIFLDSFEQCQYFFDASIKKQIDIYMIPRLKGTSYGTLISNYRNQKILIIDIFDISKTSNIDKELGFAALVLLHELCHYILAHKKNSVSKTLRILKEKYSILEEQIHELEEILILALYPTGILGVSSNLIIKLRLDTRRNASSTDYIGICSEQIIPIISTYIKNNKKFNDFHLFENIFQLCNKKNKRDMVK